MNHLTYDELEIGCQESFSASVTQEMMEFFCRMSGDVSPIHLDEAYARQRGYPGRVCYGMLVASFFSTMAGTYLPGEHCLLHSVQAVSYTHLGIIFFNFSSLIPSALI